MSLPDTGRYGGTVRRTVLPGGLRVITETQPYVRSVSFGIWVGIGSRDEQRSVAGSSHFLEHLLFKGTQRRTALEISSAIEAVGGDTNAFTAKEYTCYYARVLDTDTELAVDVVSDMLTSSLIDPDDLEIERGVILEEIAMHDDDPGDAVHDLFARALYGTHPLGRPVIGSTETISAMTRDQVFDFYTERYRPPNLVVSIAGNVDHDRIVDLVQRAFASDGAGVPAPVRGTSEIPVLSPTRVVAHKDTEQAHLIVGARAFDRHDDRRFALDVLNQVLGGGMSSRLFQEIREERGLAYSVYSYASRYADTGMFGVYAGCAPSKVTEVVDLIAAELHTVAEKGLSEAEVVRGKGMLAGATVLGLEDSGSRMSRLGKGELLYGDVFTIDEQLARIEAVTAEEVRSVASTVLNQPMSLGLIGPFDPDRSDDWPELS